MSSYEVGTVLWIIHEDRPGLMAYRVVEEITKKTLEGEQIRYLIQAAVPKSKTVQLESVKGKILETSEEAKNVMIENATKAIDGMVNRVQGNVDKYFSNRKKPQIDTFESLATSIPSDTSGVLKPGYEWMDLDGKKVQVKIPEIMK